MLVSCLRVYSKLLVVLPGKPAPDLYHSKEYVRRLCVSDGSGLFASLFGFWSRTPACRLRDKVERLRV